jgi:hypothetical protein
LYVNRILKNEHLPSMSYVMEKYFGLITVPKSCERYPSALQL